MPLTPTQESICPPSSDGQGWEYIEPATGDIFRSQALAVLIRKVLLFRSGMKDIKLDLEDGWESRLKADICATGKYPCHEVSPPGETPLAIAGRALWAELHAYTLAFPVTPTPEDVYAAQGWLAGWRGRIPNWSCRCREHFAEIEAGNPFRLTSRREFYLSGVENHDLINVKLGKPTWAAGHFSEIAAAVA